MDKITATNSQGYESPAAIAADAVILTVADGELQFLALERFDESHSSQPAIPGGMVAREEGSARTVARKLQEKTGMTDVYFEQLRTYDDPSRDPRGWITSIAYMALVPSTQLPEDSDARWIAVSGHPPLAFDHAVMVRDTVQRLRGKLWYTNVAAGLLPARFTFTQAREVFQAIEGKALDPGNFTRRLNGSGLVRKTGEHRTGGPGRRAELIEFVSRDAGWSV